MKSVIKCTFSELKEVPDIEEDSLEYMGRPEAEGIDHLDQLALNTGAVEEHTAREVLEEHTAQEEDNVLVGEGQEDMAGCRYMQLVVSLDLLEELHILVNKEEVSHHETSETKSWIIMYFVE